MSRPRADDWIDDVPNCFLLLRPASHSRRRRASRRRRQALPRLSAADRHVFAALASFAAPDEVSGVATEYVRVGDQGARFRFRFCPVCGTTLFHTKEGGEGSVGVSVGAFADPGFPAPRVSIYDSRRHPWVRLPPGVRAFEKDP